MTDMRNKVLTGAAKAECKDDVKHQHVEDWLEEPPQHAQVVSCHLDLQVRHGAVYQQVDETWVKHQ